MPPATLKRNNPKLNQQTKQLTQTTNNKQHQINRNLQTIPQQTILAIKQSNQDINK